MERPKLFFWRSCGSVLIGCPVYVKRLDQTIKKSYLEFSEGAVHLTVGESISNPSVELLIQLTAIINIAIALGVEDYRQKAFQDPSRLMVAGRLLLLEELKQN